MNREHLAGILLIAVSAASFGAMPIFARAAYAAGADVHGVLLVRFALAGLVLAGLMRATGRRFPAGRAFAVAAAMGAIGYVGQAYAYFTALEHASAGLVALLLYLYPALVSVGAALFLGEAFTRRKAVLLALSFAGTALAVGAGGGSALGVGLGIAAALIYSAYILVGGRLLRAADVLAVSGTVCIAAATVLALAVPFHAPRFPAHAGGWVALAAIALLSTALAIAGFFAGVQRIGASRAAIVSTLEPAVTIALAALTLGEPVLPLQLVGCAMILAAAALVARPARSPAS